MINLAGTARAVPASQTLAKLAFPWLTDTFGITRVADITGLDTIGIPVHVCFRPNSKTLATTQGKGITFELARASAIIESVEMWHAENIAAPIIRSAYEKLPPACRVADLGQLVNGYVSYDGLERRTLAWLRTTEVLSGGEMYMPYPMLCLDSTIHRTGSEIFASTSNGLAAGNTFDEALCHGLYEVIERDSLQKFRHLSAEVKRQRGVDLASIKQSNNAELVEKVRAAGLQLLVWDITSDYRIPAFAAELDDPDTARGLGMFSGSGCHLSRDFALSRAITEAAQSRLTFISGARDDFSPHLFLRSSGRHRTNIPPAALDFMDCHDEWLPSAFEQCKSVLLDRLQSNGITHVSVFDHSRAHFPLSVVHVLVPGLGLEWKSHRMSHR